MKKTVVRITIMTLWFLAVLGGAMTIKYHSLYTHSQEAVKFEQAGSDSWKEMAHANYERFEKMCQEAARMEAKYCEALSNYQCMILHDEQDERYYNELFAKYQRVQKYYEAAVRYIKQHVGVEFDPRWE